MGQQPAPEAPGPRPVPEPDAPGTAPRVNALAYPSPSTGLYILLVAALTSVGAFAGSWLFNQVRGREWVLAMEACSGDAAAASGGPPGTGDPLRYQDAFVQCTAALERQRGLWFVAGALAVAAAAVALLWVVPVVLTRRHRLRPLPEALAPVARRADGLAAEARVRRRPRLVVGPSGLPDAFTFGTPGSYRVALPPKLLGLLARPGPADGVLRHEYAHVAHRDVELAWLARCAWYVVLPVLLVPVLGAFVSGDLSLLGAYVWRAAIVAAVVELVAARNLRAREHDADLRASALDAAGMARTLALLRARPDDSRPAGSFGACARDTRRPSAAGRSWPPRTPDPGPDPWTVSPPASSPRSPRPCSSRPGQRCSRARP